MKFMKWLFFLVSGLIFLFVLAIPSVSSIKKQEVYGEVTEREYKEVYVGYNTALKKPKVYSTKYLVTITYKDLPPKTFDSKTLYETVNEGDTVKILLCNGYNIKGRLVWQGLELIE